MTRSLLVSAVLPACIALQLEALPIFASESASNAKAAAPRRTCSKDEGQLQIEKGCL